MYGILPSLVEEQGGTASSANIRTQDTWNKLRQAPSSASLAGWQQRVIAMSTKYNIRGSADVASQKYGLQAASTEALLYTQQNKSTRKSQQYFISNRLNASYANQAQRNQRQRTFAHSLAYELANSLSEEAQFVNQPSVPPGKNKNDAGVISLTTRHVHKYRVGQAFFQALHDGSTVKGTVQHIYIRAQPPHVLCIKLAVPMPAGRQQVLAYAFSSSLYAVQALDERFEVALADAHCSLRSVELHVGKVSELKRACPYARASRIGRIVDDDIPDRININVEKLAAPDENIVNDETKGENATHLPVELDSTSTNSSPRSSSSSSSSSSSFTSSVNAEDQTSGDTNTKDNTVAEPGASPHIYSKFPLSSTSSFSFTSNLIEREKGQRKDEEEQNQPLQKQHQKHDLARTQTEAEHDLDWATQADRASTDEQHNDVDLFASLVEHYAPMDQHLFRIARLPGRVLLRLLTINARKIEEWWVVALAAQMSKRNDAVCCIQRAWRLKHARLELLVLKKRASGVFALANRMFRAQQYHCFQNWLHVVQRNQSLREKLGIRRSETRATVFRAWSKTVTEIRNARLVIQKDHIHKWKLVRLYRVFVVLDEHRVKSLRVKGIMRRAILRSVANIFDAWIGVLIDKRLARESFATEVQRVLRGYLVRCAIFRVRVRRRKAMEIVAKWGQSWERGHIVRRNFRNIKALCLARKREVIRQRRREAREKAGIGYNKFKHLRENAEAGSNDRNCRLEELKRQRNFKAKKVLVVHPETLKYIGELGIRLEVNGKSEGAAAGGRSSTLSHIWTIVKRERGLFAGLNAIRNERKRTVEFLTLAKEVLCPRCRKVVRVRKLEHLKQRCIAESALLHC